MKFLFFLLALIVSIGILQAQQYTRISSRWKTKSYIHVESAMPSCTAIQDGWWSAQWIIEEVEGELYFRFRSRFRVDQYLNIQTGKLTCSTIQPEWQSAQWSIEPAGEYFRIRSRWKPDQGLHIESGELQCAVINPGWYSAQWMLTGLDGFPVDPTIQHASSGKPSLPDNDVKNFTPKHGGIITSMVLRYTDQANLMSNVEISPGDHVYVFPQAMKNVNRDGINFDPNKPPVCGLTLTVKGTQPLSFTEPFPMIRNQANDYFLVVVEVYK